MRATKGGHDVWTLLGIGVVAAAAAVMSFASLQQLGQRAGYPPGLAALLPLAIDAQAVVATRAWLADHTPDTARGYARDLALAAVALSVIGNAGQHAMAAYAITTPWWVVVLVAAVPPAALAATAHLAALLANRPAKRSRRAPIDRASAAQSTPDRSDSTAASTRQLTSGSADRPGDQRESSAPSAASRSSQRRSIEALRAELAAGIDDGSIDPTTAESIRRALRCSPDRARQLRDEHLRPHLVAVGDQA